MGKTYFLPERLPTIGVEPLFVEQPDPDDVFKRDLTFERYRNEYIDRIGETLGLPPRFLKPMHPEQRALLDGILAHPEQDVRRLIYADWLQEHGQEDRAEFIRVQIEYTLIHEHYSSHTDDSCAICRRGVELDNLLQTKFKISLFGPSTFASDDPYRLMGLNSTGPRVEWNWHRGFICDMRMPWLYWFNNAKVLITHHPIREVRLTTIPEVEISPRPEWSSAPITLMEDGVFRVDLIRGLQSDRDAWINQKLPEWITNMYYRPDYPSINFILENA